ncbi:MAG: hypothetical protein J0L84_14630 [Verrucomicrobia bacterium]|nr:hypothetical protein [Verrucomicrobiota bacterium]
MKRMPLRQNSLHHLGVFDAGEFEVEAGVALEGQRGLVTNQVTVALLIGRWPPVMHTSIRPAVLLGGEGMVLVA